MAWIERRRVDASTSSDVAMTGTDDPALTAPRNGAVPSLDHAVFDETAKLLGPAQMARFCGVLNARGEAIRLALTAPLLGATSEPAFDLTSAVHTLASSAGMFGFLDVLATARAVEAVLLADEPDIHDLPPHLAPALDAAIGDMQAELRRLVPILHRPDPGDPT